MKAHVMSKGAGAVFVSPLDVVLSPRRVVQPDVIYVSNKNQAIIQDRIRGVPDLVVEVISEGTRHRDRIDKKALYEQARLQEYWMVDTETRRIEVFVINRGAYQLFARAAGEKKAPSKLLPGFALSYDELEV